MEYAEVLGLRFAYSTNGPDIWGDVLKIPPLAEKGTVLEIAALFGGPAEMRQAVDKLPTLLYAPD